RPIKTVITGVFSFLFVSSIIFVGLIYPKYGCSFKWHYCYSDDVFNYPSKIILDGTEYSFGAQRSSNYQLGSTTHFLSILITLRKNNSDNFTSWIKVTRIWLRKDNIILTILTILTAECSDSSHLSN
ncbi:MAG: hypothetical protein P8Y97_24195, partial [Candidatus Lokiarchaeota archaeon]